jgi:hypothetical protein
VGRGWGGAGRGMGTLMPPASIFSYDSNLNASRDDKKNKFASTMEFVEDYLNNVVSEAVPFANDEKNILTFEVGCGSLGLEGSGAMVLPLPTSPPDLVGQGWIVGSMIPFFWCLQPSYP